ncbi:hypothetical protein [Streptomyces sp. NPDC058701]|uniref:hypothetical protein n=1 Tax=Streptomyces sp. NPDC058701 TaxID=3346608 RepID=UPI00364A30E3
MTRSEHGGRAGGGSTAPWRVTVETYGQRPGPPPYDRRGVAAERPLASRDGLGVHGRVGAVSCVDAAGETRWTHRCAGRPNAAHIAGGRVLVTTDSLEYTPWGNLGPALLLDLSDGAKIAELRGERGAALPGGRFLLGLEGYDVFDTWEHDRDGAVVDTWRSYGHYVVGTGIRVVEADRAVPTSSRVVRLQPGGVIERGPRLNDPTPPRPLVLDDGTILALDAGVLRAVDRRLRGTVLAELLPIAPDRASGHVCTLRREGTQVTAVIAEPLPDQHPIRYTIHTWTLNLRPPRT